jgi:2-amino-4-hydroxy-6-hydroxymethyldihydropteridine diphosphokinase
MGTVVYLGLGSNLGDSILLLKTAIDALSRCPQFEVTGQSPIYRSKPLDNMDQPDYYNMVVEGITSLSAEDLLDRTQEIENANGRLRGKDRWQARTLDIDILTYGQQIIKTNRLLIPHIGITERDFVLYPLNDLAPELMIPLFGRVKELVARCDDRGLEVVATE